MRPDLSLAEQWVDPNARVLDLGCGDGALLEALQKRGQRNTLGVEIDADQITRCLTKGLNVIEQDLNLGLRNFGDAGFDVVVMAHSLQTMRFPHDVVDEMLRIGREAIVSFPNFGHWRNRLQLASRGRMPVSRHLPYNWFDTPNIHFFTLHDFEQLCHDKSLSIVNRAVMDSDGTQGFLPQRAPNFFAQTAVYHLRKQDTGAAV